jgi:hypothetical protein
MDFIDSRVVVRITVRSELLVEQLTAFGRRRRLTDGHRMHGSKLLPSPPDLLT